MPRELTPRQWRALATVYHLYVASWRGDGGATARQSACDTVRPTDVGGEEEEEAVQWVEGVLPFLQRAFPEEELTGTGRRRGDHDTSGRKGRHVGRWRQCIPTALDAFLAELLAPPASPSLRDATGPALTANERTLLRLLNKEQRLADRCYQRHMALLERVRREGQALIRLAAECAGDDEQKFSSSRTEMSSGGGAEASFPARVDGPVKGARKRGRAPGGDYGQSPEGVMRADLPSDREVEGAVSPATTAAPSEEEAQQGAPSKTITAARKLTDGATATVTTTVPSLLPAPAAMVYLTCAGCGEQGGEIFQCRHCHSLRHEVCDGPRLDSETGLCVACSHELGLSLSSSLRSSTSTEEREALSEDDTSSLSGFIVHSSEASESDSTAPSSSSVTSSEVEEERRLLLSKASRRKQRGRP
ncbi:hypothetical protein TraAM80_07848 [Trypanosoma rangeli]|uniref:Uncharacterized protein n=1 Tax=Trypanosoma rangeli TaxID=5698 RepID=A0A422N3K5_TRYRA|nr:uncharacterized protein TraAM80_07848 [Trypanosoma rangeli]RNF00020.1 hypothetical protein TraAM80_07848 [Trypanosoma rangeli]|eukprot:RNF00020.1 hypothetical protein TraAM80_07848 [Trypanosoma rangeli]